jgi:hypothetical protein
MTWKELKIFISILSPEHLDQPVLLITELDDILVTDAKLLPEDFAQLPAGTPVMLQEFTERSCRVCGCTQEDCSQCIAATGQPCFWIEQDLCSRCKKEEPADQAALPAINRYRKGGVEA